MRPSLVAAQGGPAEYLPQMQAPDLGQGKGNEDRAMTYDPRWEVAARHWLQDCELPNGNVLMLSAIERYTPKLAQQLQDIAEQFITEDIPLQEQNDREAARDAYWDRKIDEARGK